MCPRACSSHLMTHGSESVGGWEGPVADPAGMNAAWTTDRATLAYTSRVPYIATATRHETLGRATPLQSLAPPAGALEGEDGGRAVGELLQHVRLR